MKRLLLSIVFPLLWVVCCLGQQAIEIYNIHKGGMQADLQCAQTPFSDYVVTEGVVTLKCDDGYYIQDLLGDGDMYTNDAMFVVDTIWHELFSPGNLIRVTGYWSYVDGRLELSLEGAPELISYVNSVAPTDVVFPTDFTNYTPYVGMTLRFVQSLVVTSNYNWERYGQLTLSSHRLISPTEVVLPGSSAYYGMVASNNADQLVMDDGSSVNYPDPIPFADADGTRRTGTVVDDLTAVMHTGSYGYYVVPTITPQFYGNPRPDTVMQLGNYSLKVCAFNLEYYLASDFGTGFGPDNAAQAALQHSKILAACLAIDADIFGFVEIQTGQGAITQLCNALNSATGTNNYAFVNDGTSTNGSYTKVGYIYRQDKVTADKQIQSLNTVVSNRKKAQGFTQKSTGQSFIYVLEHYKSKSGTGTGVNADNGDGQGSFNGNRVTEAEATVSFIERCKSYFGYDDVLIMGDLNAYAMEDPLQVLYKVGYSNQFTRFDSDTAYSYSFKAQAGCLDHILANRTMASQITGVKSFHINADEPTMFDYNRDYVDNMYRCSDHDPVVCGLNLGVYNDSLLPVIGDKVLLYPNPAQSYVDVMSANNYRLRIVDYNGTVVYNEYIGEDIHRISLTELALPQGVYLFQFKENKTINPKTVVLKLIVN